MTDKYKRLRGDLEAAIADAKRQGGVNERAEQIAALLAERDALAAAPVSAEPLFWYRPRSDGGFEGPLHNDSIEDVRKNSGAWISLFPGAAPVSAEPVAYKLPGGTAHSMGMDRYQDATCFGGDKAKLHAEARKHSYWKPLYAAPVAAQAQPVDISTEMQGKPVDDLPNLQGQQQPVRGADELPIELRGISEAIGNGGGFWRSCSGCHESNEGMATGPFSETLKCHLGVGCSECGGVGAIWDTTDYDAMADFMTARGQQTPENTETVACGCGDMFSASSYGAGFIAATGHCENCDAAQGADADKVDAEPDMFWNADNPEQCQDSIHNLLVEVQCDRTLRVGDIVEVQQAMSLPTISVRVTAVDGEDDDGDLKYEIVNDAAIDAARKEQA